MKSNKNIKLLLFGRGVSEFGYTIYLIAFPLFVLSKTESLKDMGIFFSFSSLPAIILSPFLGSYIEKMNKKKIIVSCDMVNGLLYLFLYFNFFNLKFIYILFTITIFNLIVSKIFSISSKVLFTEILDEDELEKYNGLQSLIENSSVILGPILGTFLYGAIGFKSMILILSCAYIFSSIQEMFITYLPKIKNETNEKYITLFIDGFKYIKRNENILYLFLLVMSLNFFIANNDEIINPGILVQKFKISLKSYGLSGTFLGVGSILASSYIFINKKFSFLKNLKLLFILNSSFMVIIGILSLLVPIEYKNFYFTIFLILQFFIGVVTTFINVPLIAFFQKNVEVEYQSRFFSNLSFFSSLLVPAGILYTGYISNLIGADKVYILNNFIIILIVIYLGRKKKDII